MVIDANKLAELQQLFPEAAQGYVHPASSLLSILPKSKRGKVKAAVPAAKHKTSRKKVKLAMKEKKELDESEAPSKGRPQCAD